MITVFKINLSINLPGGYRVYLFLGISFLEPISFGSKKPSQDLWEAIYCKQEAYRFSCTYRQTQIMFRIVLGLKGFVELLLNMILSKRSFSILLVLDNNNFLYDIIILFIWFFNWFLATSESSLKHIFKYNFNSYNT